MNNILKPTIHKAPAGFKTRMFDYWVCGRKAFSHENGSIDWSDVTCWDCLEKRGRLSTDQLKFEQIKQSELRD